MNIQNQTTHSKQTLKMVIFWILWTFCAVTLLVLLCFFRDSVYTTPGGPSKSFYQAASIIIGIPVIALLGSVWLVKNDFYITANLVLSIPALPALGYLLYLLIYWMGSYKN